MSPVIRFFAITVSMLGALLAVSMLTFSQPAADTAQQHQYIGASKCKLCHTTEKSGAQYAKWHESKHAQAYASLASDTAKAIAAKLGIADPQTSEKCTKCHITAYNAPAALLGEKYSKEDGVECESCHGAGGDYWKKQTMQSIYDKKLDGATVGLVLPDSTLCVTCHNTESPFFQPFDYKTAYAAIAHEIPKK